MSDNYGKNVHLDLSAWKGPSDFTFKKSDYMSLMKMAFQETIDLTHKLIGENLTGETYSIILVGGSTKDPYYREWVKSEFGAEKVLNVTYDPDKVVAQGAAYCAMLKEQGKFETSVHDVTKALSVGLADGTVSNIIEANSTIPLRITQVFANDSDNDKIHLTLFQGNHTLVKDNELIGELYYNYGRICKATTGIVYVTVSIDDKGIITFECNEPMMDSVKIVLDRANI